MEDDPESNQRFCNVFQGGARIEAAYIPIPNFPKDFSLPHKSLVENIKVSTWHKAQNKRK